MKQDKHYIHPLRRWRFNNGVFLQELASSAGISIGHLSQIERRVTACSSSTAFDLSQATIRWKGEPRGGVPAAAILSAGRKGGD